MKADNVNTMTVKKWALGAVLGIAALGGGTVAAGDYPPSNTTATTVVAVGGVSGFANTPANAPAAAPAGSTLASTGSDSDSTVKIAGGAVLAGAGLLVAAKLRRRPTAA